VVDQQARSFLKAMALLCADLGIDTVAEMVEDQATATLLSDIGVRFAQGYHFGRPQAALPERSASDPAPPPLPPSRRKAKKSGGSVVLRTRKFGKR
jgi:EAL domain-containing protein (putative c-di-GMP-specific phosphodiesterase class I)